MLLALPFAVASVFAACAAYTDLRSGEIPNRLIGIALVVAFPLQGALHCLLAPNTSLGPALTAALVSCLTGLLLCGLGPLVLFHAGAVGGGDVKLLAALGAVVGPAIGIEIEIHAFLLMTLYAVFRLARRRQLGGLVKSSVSLLVNSLRPKEKRSNLPASALTSLCFAPAVLAATLLIAALELGFGRAGFE